MNPDERLVFEAAKEIVIARMANSAVHLNADGGESVGEFFNAIYLKLLAITQGGDQNC